MDVGLKRGVYRWAGLDSVSRCEVVQTAREKHYAQVFQDEEEKRIKEVSTVDIQTEKCAKQFMPIFLFSALRVFVQERKDAQAFISQGE